MSLKVLYKAIAYLRLSKEDGDEAESNSIRNQRILIEDYVKRQADIKLIGEKVDDGYSGVNFDRPGFQEMMELIRDGKVNCVIVKDLSRFARNFVESGKYLQQIFPFLNVRFIAINDNYDSLKADYQTNNLYVPIKNLFNDAYSRDVSIKMRSFYDYKKRNGMPTCAFAVYGYRREKGSKKLLVDENVAGVIQSIAAAKLFGLSLQQIADKLNEQQVLCPAEYKRSISPNYKCGPRKKVVCKWTKMAVSRILRNRVYTGCLELGKTYRPNYKVKRPFLAAKDSWSQYENAHEAILSKVEFDTIQRTMDVEMRRNPQAETSYLLNGILFCADCHQAMVRRNVYSKGKKYVYYNCASNRKDKNECTPHNISEDTILKILLPVIRNHVEAVVEIDDMLHYLDTLPERQGASRTIDRHIKALEAELEKNRRFKRMVFEKYGEKIIDQKTYLEYTEIYSKKCDDLEAAISKRREELQAVLTAGASRNEWVRLFKKNRGIENLNRPLLLSLIERIEVGEGKNITVRFAYQNQFDIAKEYIDNFKTKEAEHELEPAENKRSS